MVEAEIELPRAHEAGRVRIAAALLLVLFAGGLVAYKASAALATLAKAQAAGTLGAKPGWIDLADLPSWLRPLAGSANYVAWVILALSFGILIATVVRALVPASWLSITVGARGARGHLLAALVGAPLMLCSCCVVPLFESVYERTRRLGPSLGLMFAAPALNPAAIALTFVLFPASIAWARLILSLVLVLGATAVLARLAVASRPEVDCELPRARAGDLARSFAASLWETTRRTLPAILVGIVLSVALAQGIPLAKVGGAGLVATTLLVAGLATLLALPTFGEIPLAIALSAAGAPDAAVIALLVAGPAINLPSILSLGRAASTRVALASALAVFAVASAGGLVAGL